MKATVLIACRNGRDYLGETLDALVSQDWGEPWEILFVDNGSTDGSRALFESYARGRTTPVMRSIDALGRPSKAYALDRGVAEAMAEAIITCDADDVPAPGYVAAMGEALQRHDLVAACCDLKRLNTGPTGIHRGLPESGIWRMPFPPYANVTGGATMGFRKALWKKLGGFSEAFPPADDIDFCVRAAISGYTLHPVPSALMHYRLRSDLRSIFWQAYSYSRSDTSLAKAYRHSASPQQDPWSGLRREARKAVRGIAGSLVGRRRHSMLEKARVAWSAGVVTGQIAGIVVFRARPTLGRPADATSPDCSDQSLGAISAEPGGI